MGHAHPVNLYQDILGQIRFDVNILCPGRGIGIMIFGKMRSNKTLRLVSFNLGIELGQLSFMAGVLLVAAAVRRLPGLPSSWLNTVRPLAAYGIGSIAALWFYQRLLQIS